MMGKLKQWLLSIAAAATLATASACGSVSGIDLADAVTEAAFTRSSEGTMLLKWEVTASPSADEETRHALNELGSGAVFVEEMLLEDGTKASLSGAVELAKGSIPFTLYFDEKTMVIEAEGLKQPYLLEVDGLEDDGLESLSFRLIGHDSEMQEAGRLILRHLLGYLPQPSKMKTGTAEMELNKELKELSFVEMELSWAELPDFIDALNAAGEDEEGLKALAESLYDLLKPALGDLFNPENDPVIGDFLDSKILTANLFAGEFRKQLGEWTRQLREAAASGDLSPDSAVIIRLLFDGTALTGMDIGLTLLPPKGQGSGDIEALRIGIERRWWNTNGDVTAKSFRGDAVPFPKDAKPRERLSNVEASSLLYDILRNDLHVTRHSFSMYMQENAGVPDGVSPYIKGAGTTMVPVRYVSEQLDAAVEWDPAAQTVTIREDEMDLVIRLRIGDKTATVNGKEQLLPEAPEMINGSTFVPIAFITRALGGEAVWDGELRQVTIMKEF